MKYDTPIIFCEVNSVYHLLSSDVYDILHPATLCNSMRPAIYHPPCRTWSRLRAFSNFIPGDHWLGVWAFIRVRTFGGVLEQPECSRLFKFMKAPSPGSGYDKFGGKTVVIDQVNYGHKCRKRTWLYIVDFYQNLELKPGQPGRKPSHIIASKRAASKLKSLPKKYRNYTPKDLALALIELTSKIQYKPWN